MTKSFSTATTLPDLPLWSKLEGRRIPYSFDIELTARCNNDCRHCYINLPAGDAEARLKELSLEEIGSIADQAASLGALWCLVTGGEPLLRPDFADIYLALKRKGLLLSVFTNACLVTDEHVRLFQQYPPRDLEISVYGATPETYEKVTRRPGSFRAFRRGLDRLIEGGVKVRLKAMALRSNAAELPEISAFCRELTKDYYRFDPLLHLRYDGSPERNAEIRAERLSPQEIAAVEQADQERFAQLERSCDTLIGASGGTSSSTRLFHCGAGVSSFSVTYDGFFRLCSSLQHPDTLYDLRKGTLEEAWTRFTPRVRAMTSPNRDFLENCRSCPLVNLCLWCPAHGYLEVGSMDGRSEYFCQVANARADQIRPKK